MSGNNKTSKKSIRFDLPNEIANNDSVAITIDAGGDSVTALHGIQEGKVSEIDTMSEDPQLALLGKKPFEINKASSFRPSVFKNTSSLVRQMSQELKALVSTTRRPPTTTKSKQAKSATTDDAFKGLMFISTAASGNTWPEVKKRFYELSNASGLLHSSFFGECIGMKKDYGKSRPQGSTESKNVKLKDFALELFRALARRNNIHGDAITKAQLKVFWEQICDESFQGRLQTFFYMVDKDADGKITEEEVEEIISLSASANEQPKIEKKAKEFAGSIMRAMDPENVGYIKINDLKQLLLEGLDHSVQSGDSRILTQIVSTKLKQSQENNLLRRRYQETKHFMLDNWRRVWIMILWIGIVAGLFMYKFIQYRNKAVFDVMGYCVCVAKGAAETLKFNMALILVPVCRNSITWLRNQTKLGKAVPFDDNINFHKVIAMMVVIGVGLHAISHLACDFPRLLHATYEEYVPMKPFFGEVKPPNYWWFLKGAEGVTGIIMTVLMIVSFIFASSSFRRNKLNLPKPLTKLTNFIATHRLFHCDKLNLPKPLDRLTGFNAFWYTHHLFVIVYTLLIVHGIKLYLTKKWYQKTTWMYLAVPVVLYGCERLVRVFRSRVEPVTIRRAVVYPGNVMSLYISKPQGFIYKSGQYMFVKCEEISPLEWHPFSITSAPGDDYLSVHIRGLGDWTNQLIEVFSKECKPPAAGESGVLRADFKEGENNPISRLPEISIDGPYGAPAQEYNEYDVVLLIGLGIGATPMISVVKDIINNIKELNNNNLETGNNKKKNGEEFKTRRAYLYWVTGEQKEFDWFKRIINEVMEVDNMGVIEMHNYCTNMRQGDGDALSAIIPLLQLFYRAMNGVDVVYGTRLLSHFGRPNWKQVYKNVAVHHPRSRVGVFYCGRAEGIQEQRQLALDFTHNSDTQFEFHKENF